MIQEILLCWGGSTETKFADIYNELSNTLTLSQGEMLEFRKSFAVEKLRDGRIYIMGGFNEVEKRELDSIEVYDPLTQSFTAGTFKLPAPRWNHSSLTLDNGDVLVIGGITNNTYNNTIDLINTNEWKVTATFDGVALGNNDISKTIRAIQIQSNLVLIVSTDNSYLLNILTKDIVKLPEPPEYLQGDRGPYFGRIVLSLSGKVIVIGGRSNYMHYSAPTLVMPYNFL